MKNHLRRHVQRNVKGKLDTDDEGGDADLMKERSRKYSKRISKKIFEDDEVSLDENGNEMWASII